VGRGDRRLSGQTGQEAEWSDWTAAEWSDWTAG